MDGIGGGFKNPAAAAQAYRNSAQGGSGEEESAASTDTFSSLLGNAISDVVQSNRTAEALSTAAASGERVPMQEVIQAVAKAELTLSTMVSVRDRAVEAYQEIIRMPI